MRISKIYDLCAKSSTPYLDTLLRDLSHVKWQLMPSSTSEDNSGQYLRDSIKGVKSAKRQLMPIKLAALSPSTIEDCLNQTKYNPRAKDVISEDQAKIDRETLRRAIAQIKTAEDMGKFAEKQPKRLKKAPRLPLQPMEEDECSDTEYNVPTTNKFGRLPEVVEKEQDKTTAKKMPPIIITGEYSYKTFVIETRKLIGPNFKVEYSTKGLKVLTTEEAAYDTLVADLKKNAVEFHTYTKRWERTKKIVLKAAPGMDTEEIKEALSAQNINVKKCTPMQGKNQEAKARSYLVQTTQETNLRNVRKIEDIDALKVKWETYTRSRNYTQCFNCQRFGHGQSTCSYKPRCVKCPGQHGTRDCKITKDQKAKCTNCGGDHPANYSQCTTLLEFLDGRNKANAKKNPTRTFNSTPITQGIKYSMAASGARSTPVPEAKNWPALRIRGQHPAAAQAAAPAPTPAREDATATLLGMGGGLEEFTEEIQATKLAIDKLVARLRASTSLMERRQAILEFLTRP